MTAVPASGIRQEHFGRRIKRTIGSTLGARNPAALFIEAALRVPAFTRRR